MLQISFHDKFDSEIWTPIDSGKILLGGWFDFEAINPDGTKAWIEKVRAKNGVVNSALDDILNVYFGAGSQKTTWYAGLIDNASFSALSASDTMSSHGGWIENTQYNESVRQTWGVGASSGQTVTNASAMAFTINASVTIKGGFMVSNSTKGGTSGTLWATGAFGSNQVLTNGQVLRVTYTLTSSGS